MDLGTYVKGGGVEPIGVGPFLYRGAVLVLQNPDFSWSFHRPSPLFPFLGDPLPFFLGQSVCLLRLGTSEAVKSGTGVETKAKKRSEKNPDRQQKRLEALVKI